MSKFFLALVFLFALSCVVAAAEPCHCPGVIGGICECGPGCGCDSVFVSQAVPPAPAPVHAWTMVPGTSGWLFLERNGQYAGSYNTSTGTFYERASDGTLVVSKPPIDLPKVMPAIAAPVATYYSDITGSTGSCANGQCGTSAPTGRVGLFGRRRGG